MERQGTSFKQVIGSILAGAIGIQSEDRYQRDFNQGKPIHFIMGGILFTSGFVVLLVVMVNWLVSHA